MPKAAWQLGVIGMSFGASAVSFVDNFCDIRFLSPALFGVTLLLCCGIWPRKSRKAIAV